MTPSTEDRLSSGTLNSNGRPLPHCTTYPHLPKCSRCCQICCHKAEPCCRQQTDSREIVPSQCEGLVYAVVVDQLYLESPIGVQWQPASREHQVDLELVGWGGGGDAQLSTIMVRNLRWLIDTYRRRARSPWSKGRGFPVQAKGCCSIQAPHTRPPLKKDFMIWIKNHLGSPQSCK